jgi:hypothetical protein
MGVKMDAQELGQHGKKKKPKLEGILGHDALELDWGGRT